MRGSGVGRSLSMRLIDFAAGAGVADIFLFTGDAHGFWQRIGFTDITLDGWREPARQSWQWRYIDQHREWAEEFGLHTMWMSASR
jgi:N-acetylglutamate synthase-like GNAT family acetyltransferase